MKFVRLYSSASEIPNSEFQCGIRVSSREDAPNQITEDVSDLCDLTVRIEAPFDQLTTFTNDNGGIYRRVK